MEQQKILTDIVRLIKENCESVTCDITMNTSFQNDLGLDSMRLVGAIVAVEEHFDVEIPDSKLFKIKTVGDLVEFIESNV